MKKLLALLATFTSLTAPASAADLPRRAPPPVFTPVPVFTWTGAYFGINAGYAFDATSNSANGFTYIPGINPLVQVPGGTQLLPAAALLRPGSTLTYANNDHEGFSGGGQVGYNYQFTPGSGVVVGFEADAQYLDFGRRSRFTITGATDVGFANFVPANGLLSTLDFFGTVRGRLGYAFDRVLFYGTGGFAYATGDQGSRIAFQNFSGNRNDFLTGWTVGGGIEYALPTDSFLNLFRSSAVTVKVEGLYVNLDRGRSTGLPLVGGLINAAGQIEPVFNNTPVRNGNDNAFAVIRAGLNYKFGSY